MPRWTGGVVEIISPLLVSPSREAQLRLCHGPDVVPGVCQPSPWPLDDRHLPPSCLYYPPSLCTLILYTHTLTPCVHTHLRILISAHSLPLMAVEGVAISQCSSPSRAEWGSMMRTTLTDIYVLSTHSW